jgi:hypothetical protein
MFIDDNDDEQASYNPLRYRTTEPSVLDEARHLPSRFVLSPSSFPPAIG